LSPTPRLEQVVVAREVDILGAADLLREVTTGLDRDGSVPDAMEN
jgi:hypothetical protein